MKILFIDATSGFTPTRIEEKPCGGILTSLTIIPRLLASYGHDVSVLSEYATGESYLGVKYIKRPIEKNVWDTVVFNRNMLDRVMLDFFKGSRTIWWLHDVVDHRYLEDDAARYVQHVVALSRYCRDSYADFYSIPIPKFSIIPNGVDKDIFYPGRCLRNRNLYVMASAPIKGLFPVEFVFNNMRRISPDFELRAYMKGDLLHGVGLQKPDAAKIERLVKAGINVVEPIPQRQLADVFRQAWVLIMPNHYPEICSNIMLQAQACGLPVITTPIGSAPEFITHNVNGLLTRTLPHDWYLHWKVFAEECASLYFDKDRHARISAQAPAGVLDWEQVALMWHEMLVGRKEAVGV